MLIETQADYRTAEIERDALAAEIDRLESYRHGVLRNTAIPQDAWQRMLNGLSDVLSDARGDLKHITDAMADYSGGDDADDRAWANSRLGVTTGRAA